MPYFVTHTPGHKASEEQSETAKPPQEHFASRCAHVSVSTSIINTLSRLHEGICSVADQCQGRCQAREQSVVERRAAQRGTAVVFACQCPRWWICTNVLRPVCIAGRRGTLDPHFLSPQLGHACQHAKDSCARMKVSAAPFRGRHSLEPHLRQSLSNMDPCYPCLHAALYV